MFFDCATLIQVNLFYYLTSFPKKQSDSITDLSYDGNKEDIDVMSLSCSVGLESQDPNPADAPKRNVNKCVSKLIMFSENLRLVNKSFSVI